MKINDLDEGILDFFGLGGKAEPIPAPSWLSDENAALWSQKQPTTADDRFVVQFQKYQKQIEQGGLGLADMVNDSLNQQLQWLDR